MKKGIIIILFVLLCFLLVIASDVDLQETQVQNLNPNTVIGNILEPISTNP